MLNPKLKEKTLLVKSGHIFELRILVQHFQGLSDLEIVCQGLRFKIFWFFEDVQNDLVLESVIVTKQIRQTNFAVSGARLQT